MRRDRDSDNGLTEAMVAELVRAGREDFGIRRVSLNFATFRGVFSAAERVGARPLARLSCRLLRLASRYWQIETLYRSNARYQPSWRSRYLCYDSALTLGRVAYAAAAVEGFAPAVGRPVQARDADAPVDYQGRELSLVDAVRAQRSHLRDTRAGAVGLSREQQARARKIQLLRDAGRPAYPAAVACDTDIAELRHRFGDLAPATRTDVRVAIAGRVRALRDFGGLVFATLHHGPAHIQIIATAHGLGEQELQLLRHCADIGDFIAATGEVVTSRSGELSVELHGWQMAAKCLTPMRKATPTLMRTRRPRPRHIELIEDLDAAAALTMRGAAIGEIRARLASRGFLEVETPMLQPVHGGANARPFTTHLNALDQPMYLRIAPELSLKRLCVGGMSKIFELNRNFRNEGIDDSHNPEFTALEAYQAYADYHTMRELARDLVLEVATATHGSPLARRRGPDGTALEVDLSRPWSALTVHEAVSRACGTPITPDTTAAELGLVCRAHGVQPPADASAGALVVKLYERLVEPHTVFPTFYFDFPVETSPLARAHRSDPRLAERWDLVAFGIEIATAYSELNDPIDQRTRLTEQSARRAAGDPEAMELDEQFLAALACAMPPTGGLGLGVDRLIMTLTGRSIRQTIAFPLGRTNQSA